METRKIRYVVIGVLTVLVMMLFAQSGMAGAKLPGDEKAVVRFDKPSEETVKEFSAPDYDVAAYRPGVYLDIVMTVSEFRTLRSRGLDVRITQTENRLKNNLKKKQRDVLEGYRDYEQMLAELRQIEADHPDICKLYDIGDSWGKIYFENGDTDYANFNHEIWAMKVSDNVNQEEDEPGVYYMGEHHSREPISMEMVMTFLNHIVDNYGTDETITNRVNDTQIWFVPLMNPNGHKIVTSDIENMWRKNIRDNNGNGQFDDADNGGFGPDGVDPNRNYGFDWGPISTSNDPDSSVYHGPEPWSEPENQAVKNFLDSHHLLAGISYHTYGEWVLYPYGSGDGFIAPDRAALEELAVTMGKATPGFVDEAGTTEYPHGHYDPSPSWGLYPTQGDHNDYAYGVNGSFSFTVEMAREFIPPADVVSDICKDNLEAAMILLNRPWHSTLTGYVTDAVTGKPVEAEIVIHGIDDIMEGMDDRFVNATHFRHPYKSNEAFGHYYRMLTDGIYTVTFRAAGYKAETRGNIQVSSAGQTSLDVALEKSACPINAVTNSSILPGMVGGSIFIPLAGEDVAKWNITYNGKTDNVPGNKTMHRMEGLVRGVKDVTVTARGFDSGGNPCEDAKSFTIEMYSANCPDNSVNGDDLPSVTIDGSVTIPLKGSGVETWEVTYNNKTTTLPGIQASYELTGLVGGAADVVVTAKGFDTEGAVCEDTSSFSLNFATPTYSGTSLTPSGPYTPGDVVKVQIQTANAVSVTLSDGVSIADAEMTPANSPIDPDYNDTWPFYNNTWTYDYTAFLPGTLTATVTNPNGSTATYGWDIDIQSGVRTVSGKVTDANTGWPLFAEVVYGLGATWTDPVTGEYSVNMPDTDYEFTVNAWTDGYQGVTRTVAAGETSADFALTSDATCEAPGYSVEALFHESFDNCALPQGWTLNDIVNPGSGWQFDDPGGRNNLTGGMGCFAVSDSDNAGEVDVDTELITPAIDCSALTEVSLSFKYDFDTYEGLDIADADVSNDGGVTWTNVWQRAGQDDKGPMTAQTDISEYAAGQSDVRIRFHHHNAFYEVWWEIDDVRVYDSATVPCKAPDTGGLVLGNLYRSGTSEFLNNGTVSDDQGHIAPTVAVPEDPNVNDGFYLLYVPEGSPSLTGARDGYLSETKTVVVPELGAVRQDFELVSKPLDEMLDSSGLTWTSSGDLEWFGQEDTTNDGTDAAQSGGITDSQISELSTTVAGPGRIRFMWKVSSEENWDFLSLYVGDQLLGQISGDVDWRQESMEIPAGAQVLRWVYEKDTNTLDGVDTAYVDQVVFDPAIPATPEASTSAGIVTLNWNAVSAQGVQGYNVYRNGTKVSDAVITETAYTDTEAPLWATHCYTVSAVYSSGESEISYEACIMPHSMVIFVDAGATGADMGSSWANAFTELQSALVIALPGDEIWVAAGTYTPDYDVSGKAHTGSREASFQLISGVAVYGGFDGTEQVRDERNCQDNLTILSGEVITSDGESENCFHVVTGSNTDDTAVLNGFTITGGHAEDVSWRNRVGAGMFIEDGSPSLANIVFSENYAGYRGGAMYNEDACPMITNVIFRNNMGGDGAGVFNYRSSPMLVNVTFDTNSGDYGGGMYNFENSSPVLINATFVNNDAEYGGGLYNEANSNPVVVNSILWDNLADESGDQIYDVSENSEVRVGSEADISYSIVQGGRDGQGNIDDDPLFINADEGDLRLQSGSPAIGAGDVSALPADASDLDRDGDTYETLPSDLAGNPRVVEGFVDMGAFEKAVIVATYHSGDYNPEDYKIGLSELLRVIQFYNGGSYSCDSDAEDGYAVGEGDASCAPHNSDYAPANWRISLSELLRMIQLYNSSGYSVDENAEDGVSLNE